MRIFTACLINVVLSSAIGASQQTAGEHIRRKPNPAKANAAQQSGPDACGTPLAFQVLLDRRAFSPGEIDGTIGPNAARALVAFQTANKLQPTGAADCATWAALGADASSVTTKYQVTTADAAGPFAERIPADLTEQAKLSALSYRSVVERLGERFHVSPVLLARLNHGAAIVAGATIEVPAVTPFDERTKPALNASAADLRIEVLRDGSLRAMRPDGGLEFFAPVSSGSEHDPLPVGDWRVTGIQWMPAFHYNPALFWDAKPSQTRATIPPGPNNPVGVVWIDVNVEHYGLHGTPEPSHIGHTESHGCVRMTNWDAARVAALVKVGTPVVFK
jgi:lipoprotein-anchoring transpeptidase ErfK/SrfK